MEKVRNLTLYKRFMALVTAMMILCSSVVALGEKNNNKEENPTMNTEEPFFEYDISTVESFVKTADHVFEKSYDKITNHYFDEEVDFYGGFGGLNFNRLDKEVIYGLVDAEKFIPSYNESDTLATYLLTHSFFIPLFYSYAANNNFPLEKWFVDQSDYEKFMEISKDYFEFLATKFDPNLENYNVDAIERFADDYEKWCQEALESNDEQTAAVLCLVGFRAHNDSADALNKQTNMNAIRSVFDIDKVWPNGKKETAPLEAWKLKKDLKDLKGVELVIYRLRNVKVKITKSYNKLRKIIDKIDEELDKGYKKQHSSK